MFTVPEVLTGFKTVEQPLIAIVANALFTVMLKTLTHWLNRTRPVPVMLTAPPIEEFKKTTAPLLLFVTVPDEKVTLSKVAAPVPLIVTEVVENEFTETPVPVIVNNPLMKGLSNASAAPVKTTLLEEIVGVSAYVPA